MARRKASWSSDVVIKFLPNKEEDGEYEATTFMFIHSVCDILAQSFNKAFRTCPNFEGQTIDFLDIVGIKLPAMANIQGFGRNQVVTMEPFIKNFQKW